MGRTSGLTNTGSWGREEGSWGEMENDHQFKYGPHQAQVVMLRITPADMPNLRNSMALFPHFTPRRGRSQNLNTFYRHSLMSGHRLSQILLYLF